MTNPGRASRALAVAAVFFASLAPHVAGQGDMQPVNEAPNPYETIAGWAKLPEGRTWGSTSAVEIDKDGKTIWVAERCGANWCGESTLDPILKFDENGKLLKSFGSGMLISPHGIFVDRDGNVWVTDCMCTVPGGGRGRRGEAAAPGATPPPATPPPAPAVPPNKGHQVFKFSPDGKLLMTLGKAGGGRDPEYFFQPNDVLVAPSGEIFVSEGHASGPGSTARVLKFSKDGKTLIKSFGTLGQGEGHFDQPHALAMDSKGRLYVGDRNNNRIVIFDQDFKQLDEWKQFSRPSGIYIDKQDMVYVTDSESGSVSRNHPGWKRGIRIGKASDGKVIAFIPDPDENATGTSAAEGVAVDAKGHIYGAEVGPKRLQRYVKK